MHESNISMAADFLTKQLRQIDLSRTKISMLRDREGTFHQTLDEQEITIEINFSNRTPRDEIHRANKNFVHLLDNIFLPRIMCFR